MSDAAVRLAEVLAERRQRVVFAESCTAGLVSALLAAVPGISHGLCGSWVTYREASKREWLGVPAELLERHTAVSAEVTRVMAQRALELTPEADVAAAITGHLGPDSPTGQDGVVFWAVAVRQPSHIELVVEQRLQLSEVQRVARQQEAAAHVLAGLAETLASLE